MVRRSWIIGLLILTACGGSRSGLGDPQVVAPQGQDDDDVPTGGVSSSPRTTLSPGPGPFNGSLKVTLTTDSAATIYVTVDGTDPHLDGPGRRVGRSPLVLTLSQTAVLFHYARSDNGAEESPRVALYTRAGGVPGTLSGSVLAGDVTVGKKLTLNINGTAHTLGVPTAPGEVPFALSGLSTGLYRLQAVSDRDGDARASMWTDYASDIHPITLNLADPASASVEGLRIYLGVSPPNLATLAGKVVIPKPAAGRNVSVAALDENAFGAGLNPAELLRQLERGDRLFTNEHDTDYRYTLTDIAPGTYIAVPILSAFGGGGLSMNFVVSPLSIVTVAAGEVGQANFAFGPIALSGTVTQPSARPLSGVVYGVVAARSLSFFEGIQVVLMPTVFRPATNDLKVLVGAFAGEALRDNASFDLQLFTSLDGRNPLLDALAWAANPFSDKAPLASFQTRGENVTKDLLGL